MRWVCKGHATRNRGSSPLHDTQHETRLPGGTSLYAGVALAGNGSTTSAQGVETLSIVEQGAMCGDVVGTMVPASWLMHGRDRDLIVAGSTAQACVGGGQLCVQGNASVPRYESRDLHPSVHVAQTSL